MKCQPKVRSAMSDVCLYTGKGTLATVHVMKVHGGGTGGTDPLIFKLMTVPMAARSKA